MKRICSTFLLVTSIALISACGGPTPVPTETPGTEAETPTDTTMIPNVQNDDTGGYPAPEDAATQGGYPAPEDAATQGGYPGPDGVAQSAYPLPDDLDLPPDASPDQVREQVIELLDAGRTLDALAVINYAIHNNDNQTNLDLLAVQGHVFANRNRYREARSNFNQVLEQEPNNTFALLYQGIMQRNLNEFDPAIASLSQVIEQEPDNAQALVERARTYLLQENYEQALADANAALDITEDLPWAYVVRARSQAQQGNHEEARTSFERAIEVAPDQVEPAYQYGLYLVSQSDLDAAREQFQYVLDNGISPRDDVVIRRATLRLQSLPNE